ncbi:MAG: hypothetical protein C4293_19870 [Nitrospiraceae bacterium]
MLLMQFEKTAKARYSVGQAAQQDVFREQVEISRVLDRLAVLEQQKESLHAAIDRLLNRPPAWPLGTPEEIHMILMTVPLEELSRRAEDFSPILSASAKGVERGEQAVALARRQYFPDFDVSALGLRNGRINDNGYQVAPKREGSLGRACRRPRGFDGHPPRSAVSGERHLRAGPACRAARHDPSGCHHPASHPGSPIRAGRLCRRQGCFSHALEQSPDPPGQ